MYLHGQKGGLCSEEFSVEGGRQNHHTNAYKVPNGADATKERYTASRRNVISEGTVVV